MKSTHRPAGRGVRILEKMSRGGGGNETRGARGKVVAHVDMDCFYVQV
jgi:hypothetical protein